MNYIKGMVCYEILFKSINGYNNNSNNFLIITWWIKFCFNDAYYYIRKGRYFIMLPRENSIKTTKCHECNKILNISWYDGELTNGEYTEEGYPLCYICYDEYKRSKEEIKDEQV